MRYRSTLALVSLLTVFAPATAPAQVRSFAINVECTAGIRIIADGQLEYGTVPCRDARVEFQVGPQELGITGPASWGFYRRFMLTRFSARLRSFDMDSSKGQLRFRDVGVQLRTTLSSLAWDVSPTAPSGGNGTYKFRKTVDDLKTMDAPVFAAASTVTAGGEQHTVSFDDRLSEGWGYVDYAALRFSMVVKFNGEHNGISNYICVQLTGDLPRDGYAPPPLPPTPDEPIVTLGDEEEPTEPVEPDDKPIPPDPRN
jgi:hypothetical protein